MEKPITIKDIAKKLGLSTSTVSRALSDSWEIKKETKELVIKTAAELNYHPNTQAKGLVTKKSYTIGIVVPELVTSFFPMIISGIQKILMHEGYQILITQSNESAETERTNLSLLEQHMVDGIIISTTSDSFVNSDMYQSLQDNGIPLVFFNRVPSNIDTTKIIIDDKKMAYSAVAHLIGEGYRKIFHFAGPEKLDITKDRMNGYIEAMQDANLPISDSTIIHSGIFIRDGEQTMEDILSGNGEKPDAIFAFNDPVAIGAMKALKRHGLRIPYDVTFVGFSESDMATVVEPYLTSIEQPRVEIGEIAASCMLDKIRTNRLLNKKIVLDAKLNIRESSHKKHNYDKDTILT